MAVKPQIKRLLLDIETSPNVGLFWKAGYKLNISYENILKERAIICIGYKWQGDAKTTVLTWDKGDDRKPLQKIAALLNECDEVVYHNGDRFDLPWIRGRCLKHGIIITPDIKSVDTKVIAHSKFGFNSNRLDYLAQFLGLGNKIKTEFQLWKDVMQNISKALSLMVTYCKHDVDLLEKVYLKLAPYVPHKTHFGVLFGGLKTDCPDCGSTSVQRRGTRQRATAAGTLSQRLSCNDCGRMYTVAIGTVNRENKLRAKRI
jgi:RNase P subunit RPR2